MVKLNVWSVLGKKTELTLKNQLKEEKGSFCLLIM